MLFLHLKSGHVYEYAGLTVTEATMAPAVRYHPVGMPEHEFTRPASEFFDGRFAVFVPTGAFTSGALTSKGGTFIEEPGETEEEEEEDHAHFVRPKAVDHGKN